MRIVTEPTLTRTGLYAVAVFKGESESEMKDSIGNYKRSYMQELKLYKRLSSAINFCKKKCEEIAEFESRETNLALL